MVLIEKSVTLHNLLIRTIDKKKGNNTSLILTLCEPFQVQLSKHHFLKKSTELSFEIFYSFIVSL